MPFDEEDVTFTPNPLWRGGFDETADSEGAGVSWSSNPMHERAPVDSGLTRGMGDAEYARKQAQQAARLGGASIISGFRGDSGGKRSKPTVAPKLTGEMRDADQMRHVAHLQREGERTGIAALGTGRAPGYRGHDEATSDARAIVEDPRFRTNYDIAGGGAGFGGGLKQSLSSKKDVAKTAGRTFARALPFVGSGIAAGGAYKEHQRAKVDDAIAADASHDPLTRNMAGGLADQHRTGRNKEIGSAVVGLAKSTATVATGGAAALLPEIPGYEHAAHLVSHIGSELGGGGGGGGGGLHMPSMPHISAPHMPSDEHLEKAGWKAASLGSGRAYNAAEGYLTDKADPDKVRPGAVAPENRGSKEAVRAGTDSANAALMQLARSDGDFGNRMLGHLNAEHAPLTSTQAFLDAAKPAPSKLAGAKQGAGNLLKRMKGGHVDHVDRSPAVKPSQVARVVAGEDARQRQVDRMGDTLTKMSDNEERSWWEQSAPRVRPTK